MKSMPAASAILASARQSGQLALQRSGTVVAVREDEQLAPNTPILSVLGLYMAMRSGSAPGVVSMGVSLGHSNRCGSFGVLLQAHLAGLDDLAPFRHLAAIEGVESIRRPRQRRKALLGERVLDVGRVQRLRGRAGEFLDHRLRNSRRAPKALPQP